jgi:uncharacterized repeat protein (TIGR03837 family)
VDDLKVAAKLLPSHGQGLDRQTIENVEIREWPTVEDVFEDVSPAEVVIEAFACELPSAYVRQMKRSKPVWVNLEYLSAESWVQDFHARPSIHPATGLQKTCFFPGFTAQTGGLLRERDLATARVEFNPIKFWETLGVIPKPKALKASLFCYPHAPIGQLLAAMSDGTTPVHCLAPKTSILPEVAKYFGLKTLKLGETVHKGSLTLTVLPFLSQHSYDELLWACDLNFVRGEDSWIRALSAAKPFVWQTYRQDAKLHMIKLQAFLDIYQPDNALSTFNQAWLEGGINLAQWEALITHLPTFQKHAQKQTHEFEKLTDLAANLVSFAKNQV